MKLPDTFTLRIEPTGGLLGRSTKHGRCLCPVCAGMCLFHMIEGTGGCGSCGTSFESIDITADEQHPIYGARTMTVLADYADFSSIFSLLAKGQFDLFKSMLPRGLM